MKTWKKDRKSGFTLVELIVVLVILAILAALLIPALTGYINKAKEKQITAETRQAVMAAQTLVDEYYGTQDLGSFTGEQTLPIGTDVTLQDVADLAEVPVGNISSIKVGHATDTKLDGIVTTLEYTKDGKRCTYSKTAADAAGTYEIQ